MKELKVNAIKNGTVIDHISPKVAFKIVEILGLFEFESEILFGNNLATNKDENKNGDTVVKKGIIKISDRFFTPNEINKIAILCSSVTINIIKDYNVVEKKKVEIPDKICSIVKCVNPNCITNKEGVKTKFDIIDKEDLTLRCMYCEKITPKENIVVI